MARYEIQKQDAETFCDEPHPIRLGRSPQHYPGEPWERTQAIRDGKPGYLCPGGEVHLYPVWIVYDAEDDSSSNAGAFDVFREAKQLRDRLNEEQAHLAAAPAEPAEEPTSLDMLADYECPECGPVVDRDDPLCLSEVEALLVFGGDENGVMRCPNDWCDEEIELTLAARLDALSMIAERVPELAPAIAEQTERALRELE